MGCSYYFFRVSKSEVENVKDLTAAELREYARQQGVELYDDCGTNESGINFLDDAFMDKECVFDFGRLYWFMHPCEYAQEFGYTLIKDDRTKAKGKLTFECCQDVGRLMNGDSL